MARRFSVICDDALAEQIESLAREYELTQEEVLRQLITAGLDEIGELGP